MRISSGTLGNFSRAIALASVGFISSAANAREHVDLVADREVLIKKVNPVEEKIQALLEIIKSQQKEITEAKNEIEKLKADKYTKYIPLIIYSLAFLYALKSLKSKMRQDSKSLQDAFQKELEEMLTELKEHTDSKLGELLTATQQGLQATESRLREEFADGGNPINGLFSMMSKGMQGARLTSSLHHILSQLDDDFSTAVREGQFGAVGGIETVEDLTSHLKDAESEFFQNYFSLPEEERSKLPIISFSRTVLRQNSEHDEGDLPGSEISETKFILIPSEFQNDVNLYITLIAREFSRSIHMPEGGYKSLNESQINALEKEIELVENVILLLVKLNLNVGFDDLNEFFNFQIERDDFEGFKGFVKSLGLDPDRLRELVSQHNTELDSWREFTKKA